jgi:nucleotide-binding universal stress UspA family protein
MTQLKKKILCAVDGSEGALNAIRYAGQMLAGSAELVLFHVMPPAPPLYREASDPALQRAHAAWKRKQEQAAEAILAGAEGAACAAGFAAADVKPRHQQAMIGVARDILAEAYKGNYDAVLMGRLGAGLVRDLFIGSVSHKVLQHARIPLWLVEGRHLALPVLVGVDGSERSQRAVDHLGFMLEGRPDIPVTLFHVQPPLPLGGQDRGVCSGKEAERDFPFLARAAEELHRAGLPEERVHVSACRRGRDPARELLREAREGGYGTVVLGRRGLTGAKAFFLGSVSSKLVSGTRQMAVWVVP